MAYQQFKRPDLRGFILNRLGAAGSVFWRTDELNRLINQALRTFNALTGFWKTRKVITTTANTVYYSIPGTLTAGMRVEFNSHPLGYSSLSDLDNGQPGWEDQTTATSGQPSTPQMWTPVGLDLIAIWPADAAGNNSLTVDGIAQTPVLSDDNSFVDIGEEELNMLLDYIEHLAVFKEGGKEFAASQVMYQNFLKGCATRNSMLMASASFRRFMGVQNDFERKQRFSKPERLGAR